MKRLLVVTTFLIALAIAALLPVVKPVEAGSSSQSVAQTGARSDDAAAGDYCTSVGGENDVRQPYFNTNGPEQDWLRLAGSRHFCKFTSAVDGSRIHVESQHFIRRNRRWRRWPITPKFRSEAAMAIRRRVIARCSEAATRLAGLMRRAAAGYRNRIRWTRAWKLVSSRICRRLIRGA